MSEQGCARNILELLQKRAGETPGAEALCAPRRPVLSYGELWRQVEQINAALRASGIRLNDRVALALPNGPEMAVAFLGVAGCAAAAPLNPAYRVSELESYLRDLRPSAILLEAGVDSAARAAANSAGVPAAEVAVASGAPAGQIEVRASGPARSDNSEAVCLGPDDTALVLHTSGTTSRPKIVPLTHRNLLISACNIARSLELGPADRCLNVMPLFHVHGLIGALLSSLAAGASVFCTPGFYVTEFFSWLEESRATWYTAVPTMHQAILARAPEHAETIARCPLRLIRSGSAALAPVIMAELERVFQAPVIESYGMTEAAHQMTSNPLPPRKRKPGSVGIAAGPEIAILDANGEILPSGASGEVAVRGENVTPGYPGGAEASAPFGNGWFRTGDQGYLDAEGYLFLTGRIKEIINRAGEKIAPREVEEALLQHPSLAQSAAFAVPHPTLGEDVAAAVVLRPGAHAEEKELREFAAARLAHFKVPSRIAIVADVPKGPTGKVQRLGLASQLGLTAPAILAPYEAPLTTVERTLAAIWSEVLHVLVVGRNDNFLDLGGDSMLAGRLIAQVREQFSVELSILGLFDTRATIAAMAQMIDSARQEASPKQPTAPAQASLAQEQLWYLWRGAPQDPAYNRATSIRFGGRLDVDSLSRAVAGIVRRHEALRTVFPSNGGRPEIRILPALETPLAFVAQNRAPTLEEMAREPFDLENGPLFRAQLLRFAEASHILLLTVHHIIFDGWSEGIFLRELLSLYEAFSHGRTSPLPELAAPLGRGSVSQNRGGDYWRQQLAGAPGALELPSDRPRGAIRSSAGARIPVQIPGRLTESLRSLARQERATLFMVLLGGFQIVLHRYSGQDDIIVGTPFAGRTDARFENVIGLFVHTLPLRSRLAGNLSVREFLRAVRTTALEAYANQDDPGPTPVFQAAFALQPSVETAFERAGLSIQVSEVYPGTAKFDLSLSLWERGGCLEGWLEYSAALFDHERMVRMLGHITRVLESMAATPETRIAELQILTEEEQRRALVEWNGTNLPLPSGQSFHQLFEAQVQRTPEALAVRANQASLTYGELNRRANQLAHHLARYNIGPEKIVGVSLPRSPEMLIALLAVWKAGAAWLPLDPAYPRERLEFMAVDAGATLVIDSHWLESRANAIERESPANSAIAAGPENLAYVIYTSGSTGAPKGVLLEHRGLCNLATFAARTFDLTTSDRVLQFAPLSFDASVWEIGMALVSGASLYVPEAAALLAGEELAELLRQQRITALTLPPSILGSLPAGHFPALRTLIAAGEPCPPDLALAWMRGRSFYNAYGPTETTVCATLQLCDRPYGSVVPIGKPIANTQIYLLDQYKQPVPIGVPGEIYIGGCGVARGYLNRPELNAAAFIANPFLAEHGARLYKTGDRARCREDGSLEFLGRADRQVKVRGFRIELEEVEAVLRRHPAVADVAVLQAEAAQLAAYIVASGTPPAIRELRAHAKAALPSHMVPASFTILDSIPRTPAGKTDWARLPAPEQLRTLTNGSAIRTPRMRRLAQLWEEALGVAPASPQDSFFDLGGHSLLVAQVLGQVEKVYGKKIPLATLLANPTLEGLDSALCEPEPGLTVPGIWEIQAGGSRPPFFFVHGDFILGGFYCFDLAEKMGADQPFYALPQHGPDGRDVPGTITDMARDHVATLRAFRRHGPYLLGGLCNGGLIAVEMARQLAEMGEAVDLVAIIAAAPQNNRLIGLDFDAGREEITEAYRRAMIDYRPAAYAGRLTVLWPEQETRPVESLDEDAMGWRAVAEEVDLHIIPGDHNSCVSAHIADTAARLRACITETGTVVQHRVAWL